MENKKMLGAKSLLKDKKTILLSFLGVLFLASPALGAVTNKSVSPSVFVKPYTPPYSAPYTKPYTVPYTPPYTPPYTAPYTKPYTPPYKKPYTPLYYMPGSRYGYYNGVAGFRVPNYTTNTTTLMWNQDEKAGKYLIFRSDSNPNYFKKIAEVSYATRCPYGGGATCNQKNYYTDRNLKPGTYYYYKIMYIAKDGRYSLPGYIVKTRTLPLKK